ncbi:MAG: Insertion element protein [Desulfobacteraceae bacterium]|nr:MAG: Insertion element protein [Desulfobacteraceae bacterium]
MEIRCPRCNSDAYYKYGKTAKGEDRYLCLSCNRQFTKDSSKPEISERPCCPKCGCRMHVFMRHGGTVRYRCSRYPACRSFLKIL